MNPAPPGTTVMFEVSRADRIVPLHVYNMGPTRVTIHLEGGARRNNNKYSYEHNNRVFSTFELARGEAIFRCQRDIAQYEGFIKDNKATILELQRMKEPK